MEIHYNILQLFCRSEIFSKLKSYLKSLQCKEIDNDLGLKLDYSDYDCIGIQGKNKNGLVKNFHQEFINLIYKVKKLCICVTYTHIIFHIYKPYKYMYVYIYIWIQNFWGQSFHLLKQIQHAHKLSAHFLFFAGWHWN